MAAGLVDVADVLPFDTADAADVLLRTFDPRALVFGKLDVWPTLVERAAARGVRLGMVSATLSAASGRRSPLARALLRDAYARLDAVGAIAPGDAERLGELGVRAAALSVTGDARYDQAWARAGTALEAARAAVSAARDPAWRLVPTLVAGSTWPSDEVVLLAAWDTIRARGMRARMILAPHEPTEPHLAATERWAARRGVSIARLDAVGRKGAPPPEVILVDRVGVLADLYAIGDLAYVGGGFHAAGVHSVLEPAACGVPVLVGPHAAGTRDADLLVAAGAAHVVTTPLALATRLRDWIERPAARGAAGEKARAIVRTGLGAAERSAALVERLLALSAG